MDLLMLTNAKKAMSIHKDSSSITVEEKVINSFHIVYKPTINHLLKTNYQIILYIE